MATFTNMASLQFNGNVIHSNIVTGELTEVLSATKTAVTDEYRQDGTVTYVINLVNAGNTAAVGLTITDNLGAYDFDGTTRVPLTYEAGSILYFADGLLQTEPAVTAGPPLVITGIDVPANGNATILYQARVNAFAPTEVGSEITNLAEVTGNGILDSIQATASIPVSDEPQLSITKALNPTTVTDNEEITYTFTIQNTGNTPVTAENNVILTDLFDPIITIDSVTFNGTAWAAPANYTMNTATGEFATVAGQVTVPAATYTQNPDTGAWETVPGVSVLVITGTL